MGVYFCILKHILRSLCHPRCGSMGLVQSIVEEILCLTTISAPKIDLYPCTTLHAELVQDLHINVPGIYVPVPGLGDLITMEMHPSDLVMDVLNNGTIHSL